MAQQEKKKPNILILWGDDIGQFNVSVYNMGQMGYRTPNIDRIAAEGALFTDWYGQQSCTAGRAAFITGQSPIRTGLTKVGLPGAPEGMKIEDPTIAGLLKNHGYMTGQFGKNHLGDRDEMLPTNHGFDEFFGNLYHLNAEEEPEHPDYPKASEFPDFKKNFGPRGVIHSFAGGKITDTGPLTKKRMETIDEEVNVKAFDFMERAKKADKPFFLWWNSTKMHVFTHLKEGVAGKTGLGIYADGMVEHDRQVGQMLDKLKELGLEDNTIVMYSTDNGAEAFTWPDGGTTMFRGEKNTPFEGGYRVPCVMRWPGVIKPGTVINEIGAHEDMCATLLAAAGEPDVSEKLRKGHNAMGRDYKVCLEQLQPDASAQGRSQVATPGLHLLDRRRQRSRVALRQLEDLVSEAERPRPACLDQSLRRAARPDSHQPADGPVRARAGDRHGLRALVRGTHVPIRPCGHLRRPLAAELPRIPPAAETRELQSRSRDGGGDGAAQGRQLDVGIHSALYLKLRATRCAARNLIVKGTA
jgi:arylsulfatase A-like enzyme